MSNEDTIMPPIPVTPSIHCSLVSLAMESPKRRCSARLLSQSVHQTLRQLQKDEHELRVAQLVKKNITFYKRQKVCESFTTFSILVSFSGEYLDIISTRDMSCCFLVFSIYTVLSYGFQYFCTPNYHIVSTSPSQDMEVGEVVTLMCKADSYWEWCRYE
jgi:hypothetical protein